ncbi:phosphotyrosine protein phosphatase [Stagnihabitans tardus]|uniref:Phosphotyrosine protein phosphatase n=1 Tax=Stagnihabitans tardus TaxID=2699202 RepID=A0AAE5BSR5_9RHOB|nr:phosphotyrosine protein phosphatase [Stagnihabitans tardus]NBZ88190.1 phosphotyrosine protein phosphatase [Stagnihabitans tardus]
MNALFLCGKARARSPTCADLATSWGIASDFAGLSADADEKVGVEHLDWADIVFVMEARQRKRLQALFPAALRGKRLVVLNIPDRFARNDPALVALVTPKLRVALRQD